MFAPSEEIFDEEGVRRLSSPVGMHEGFVRVFFEKGPDGKRRAQRVLTVDVDSHVQTVYGQKPRAARGYNPRKRGRLSYHPLVATILQLRMPLAGLSRGGDTNGRSEIVEFFDMVMEAIESACEGVGKVRYAFAVPGNKALQAKLGGLPYKKVCPGIGVSEFFYGGVARGLSRSRRIVVVRQSVKQLGDKAQGRHFGDLPSYGYQLIATNKRGSCRAVWRFYNGRADSENVIEDLVVGVGMDPIPTGKFLANAANFWLVLIAQRLLYAYRALVGKPVTRTIPMVRTLWERSLYWGGQIVRHNARIYLDLAEGSAQASRFLSLWKQMDALGIP